MSKTDSSYSKQMFHVTTIKYTWRPKTSAPFSVELQAYLNSEYLRGYDLQETKPVTTATSSNGYVDEVQMLIITKRRAN